MVYFRYNHSCKEVGKQNLYYTLSKDGINFLPIDNMLNISKDKQSFDNDTLYKSSLVKIKKFFFIILQEAKLGNGELG